MSESQFDELQKKLLSTDSWQEHLDEALAYFKEHQPFAVMESPFASACKQEMAINIDYARKACGDMIRRGEIPFASHIKYTQEGILDDDVPGERTLGIAAGLAEGALAKKTVVYVDRGISGGMIIGIKNALKAGREVEFRSLDENPVDATKKMRDARAHVCKELAPDLYASPLPF